MARRQTILASAAMLSIGLAVGGHLETLRLTSPAKAVSADDDSEQNVPSEARALVDSGNHIAQVSSRVMPSAVHIQAVRVENERKVEETGSGVIMRSPTVKGLFVVTNNHVIRGAEMPAIDVILADGATVHPLRVYRDIESDIAIMQIPDGGQPSAKWGDSNKLEIGHFVLAVGSRSG